MTPAGLASLLRRVRRSSNGFSALCPAHDDQEQSLSISGSDDGKVLVKCFAGCDIIAITAALGITVSDLMPGKRTSATPRRKIAEHSYRDENGAILFVKDRFTTSPKCLCRRPDPFGGWIDNLEGVEPTIYRRDKLAQIPADVPIFWVEGEKCVEALEGIGCIATTSGSASSWKVEFSRFFKGRQAVYIIPDNDEPGRKHTNEVRASLFTIVPDVRVIELGLSEKGADIADWIEQGGTREKLDSLTANAPRLVESWASARTTLRENTAIAEPVLVCLADVTAEAVRYLWPGRIPLGKITLFDGDPGLGKSLVTLDVAARLTAGLPLPDGREQRDPAPAVFLCIEDAIADTIRPRFDAAGGEATRLHVMTAARTQDGSEVVPSISETLPAIRTAIQRTGARLLVIDPLMAHLGPEINSFRDQDVRQALTPLAAMASEMDLAVILVRHLTKTSGLRALYRGGGSIGISGAARAVYLFAGDSEDPDRRIVAAQKFNIGPLPSSLAFQIVARASSAAINWEPGPVDVSADELIAASEIRPEERSARDEAQDFLREFLSNGPIHATDVFRAGRKAGISEKTLRRASKTLGILSEKGGFVGGWQWRLCREDGHALPESHEDSQDGHTPDVGHLREKRSSSTGEGCAYFVGGVRSGWCARPGCGRAAAEHEPYMAGLSSAHLG